MNEPECICKIRDRLEEEESQRDWLKDSMCMYHWMQTDYYRSKIELDKQRLRQLKVIENERP